MDEKIIDELNNLSTAKRIALSAAGPAIGLMIPQVIKTLVVQFKPAIIDIIDPDADNTQPQQELEGWLEPLAEKQQLYSETDLREASAMETAFAEPANREEEFRRENSFEFKDEANTYNSDFEQVNNGMTSSNEQTGFESSEWKTNGDYHPDDREVAEVMEHQVAVVKGTSGVIDCEGYTCWAKAALNNLLGSGLKIDNRLDESTKKAIGDFQAKANLPQTGKKMQLPNGLC